MLRTAKVNQREIKENLVWININWENYVERINLNLNLEKQLNAIRKRKHTQNKNIFAKKILDKNPNPEYNFESSLKHKKITKEKLAPKEQQNNTKRKVQNRKIGIKHQQSKRSCAAIADSIIDNIDELEMSRKSLIKVRKLTNVTCSDMYRYFLSLKKNQTT